MIFDVKYFPQNYMLTKCLGCKNLELYFRVAPKSISGPLLSRTEFAKKLGGQPLLFAFRWRHHVHSTAI